MKNVESAASPPTFEELQLSPPLLEALTDEGYEIPTPIQALAIPIALSGRDLVGCAQTGTGKTAAFGLPILERLSTETFSRDPRALVLVPTRELALQAEEFLKAYGRHLRLRSVCLVGGMPMRAQIRELTKGSDIVIATPGRLLDLCQQRELRLDKVKILVLDEADRMLDMGFIPDVRRIMKLVAGRKQTLLFSATMPEEIARLAKDFLRDPEWVSITPSATPVDKIRQVLHPVDPVRKDALLVHLLKTAGWEQTLIFTRTKRSCDMLGEVLDRAGFEAEVIHGDMMQKARLTAFRRFKERDVRILVATDIASRGIDIEEISHVVNYDMAGTVEDYIHRIGRTARASAEGDAVSLVTPGDWDMVKAIETMTGISLARVMVEGFEPTIMRWMAEPRGERKTSGRRGGLLRRRR
jgi:ATP-dependent RNA helicase RhlE